MRLGFCHPERSEAILKMSSRASQSESRDLTSVAGDPSTRPAFERALVGMTVALLVVGSWWLFVVPTVKAVGVGVRPQEVEIKGQVGRMSETVLWVTNTSSEPALFTVTPDSLSS